MREDLRPERLLLEAGARNNRKDREAITSIVNAALGQLNKSDQETILGQVTSKLGIKFAAQSGGGE